MRIGRYEVIDELGAGGMGKVRLARDPAGRLVVLKTALGHDKEDDVRLRDEARVGLRLNHPGVVETVEVFEHQGRVVLVTAFVPGATLYDLRQAGPMPGVVVCRIGRQVAEALDAIHNASDESGRRLEILHRDVTAGNVMLGHDGRARLIDLGIARSVETRAMRTETGMLRGTLRYLAPELFAGESYGPASDVWSLGVVLWEALLGRPAIRGSDAEAIGRICSGNIMQVDAKELPDSRVVKAIGQLLKKKVSDRLQRAREVAALFAMVEKQIGGDVTGLARQFVFRVASGDSSEGAAVASIAAQPFAASAPPVPAPPQLPPIATGSLPPLPPLTMTSSVLFDLPSTEDERAAPAPTPSFAALPAVPAVSIPYQLAGTASQPERNETVAHLHSLASQEVDSAARFDVFSAPRRTPSEDLLDYAVLLQSMEVALQRAWDEQERRRQELHALPLVRGQTLSGPAACAPAATLFPATRSAFGTVSPPPVPGPYFPSPLPLPPHTPFVAELPRFEPTAAGPRGQLHPQAAPETEPWSTPRMATPQTLPPAASVSGSAFFGAFDAMEKAIETSEGPRPGELAWLEDASPRHGRRLAAGVLGLFVLVLVGLGVWWGPRTTRASSAASNAATVPAAAGVAAAPTTTPSTLPAAAAPH